ncbi:anti-sigma factor RsiW [Granulicella aggregans]|jgi:hypothetical protein|uniref:Anti-sigma factor RsiW n=1 Tax=Granulicella aggregans TaxID=474949 RepID=A0A7W7Z970_9BACT|nr:hypothetical protein [Granulicella aggregans]MBB5055674.1 anti-sigma factor RsiW [Granulicella aggregans]
MTQTSNSTEKMTLAEFEQRLPEFFATGTGSISDDSRLQAFLLENPDAAALVRDFEAIVEAARGMFDDPVEEPSDAVWQNIQSGLKSASIDPETPSEILAAKSTQ